MDYRSDVKTVHSFSNQNEIAQILTESSRIPENGSSVGIEIDVLPVKIFQRLQKSLPEVQWHDISTGIRWIQTIKSDFEIQWLKQAAGLLDQVFDQVSTAGIENTCLISDRGTHDLTSFPDDCQAYPR